MTTTKKPYIYEGSGSAIEDYNRPQKQLQTIVQGGRGYNKSNWGLFDKNNQQHKYLRSLCVQAKWVVENEKWGEVADLEKLSDFLKSNKCPVNMPLKKMSPEEVSKVIIALEAIVSFIYKKKS
jgi:hypothetical protein